MRFSADSYFAIGSAHVTAGKPCQDYALSRSSGGSACVVVSDGCSTGGHTDIGARILALATCRAVELGGTSWSVMDRRDMIAEDAEDTLAVTPSDMLATCVFAVVDSVGAYYRIHGDGVVALRFRSGATVLQRFEWGGNTPFYPQYSEADRQRFADIHGGLYAERLMQQTIIEPEGKVYDIPYSVQDGMRGVVHRYVPEELPGIEYIAVFSDGVTQIENVGWKDAAMELLSFKNTTGEFVKRRAMAAIRKWREIGKGPVDDFSMAAIHITHD